MKEIVGFRLKPEIDRFLVDRVLNYAMPIWNEKDKSVYFIRGHIAGSLVSRLEELKVLHLWLEPIYEENEVKSDWMQQRHFTSYLDGGEMSFEKTERGKLIAISHWIEFDWNKPETRPTECGKYLICRKDGKIHWEKWNGSGWAYNQKEIRFYAAIVNPIKE